MAGDWIKMRTDLYRDPKVCVIADLLLDANSELSHYVSQNLQRDMSVTRNVMRNVTVGALVSVWGVLRHRGKRVDDDLVIKGCSIHVIDDVSEIQGFGAAMQTVGWVDYLDGSLVFPRFFEEFNVDPAADLRAKNAERQRRFREARKAENNENSNVTVTLKSNDREEKRREEKYKDITPLAMLTAMGVDESLAKDWLKVRKEKKQAPTQTAFDRIKAHAEANGMTFEQAVRIAVENSWAGFKVSWMTDGSGEDGKPAKKSWRDNPEFQP